MLEVVHGDGVDAPEDASVEDAAGKSATSGEAAVDNAAVDNAAVGNAAVADAPGWGRAEGGGGHRAVGVLGGLDRGGGVLVGRFG
ncbi:hypothetical protein GCM10029964_121720 [Kibdelosporangium lantanae]